jgi:hypothetical protein
MHSSRQFIFSRLALIAATIVLMLISAAPAAGLRRIPKWYNTPAASGSAMIL